MTTRLSTKRYAELATTKKQKTIAKRLAATEPGSEAEYDILQEIDETHPAAALWIIELADFARSEQE